MSLALDNIRVTAFTHFAAGPLAAQYLGALGADVVKIESPKKDVNRYAVRDPEDSLNGVSPYFVCTNRNQRSIVLDLKSQDGKAIAEKIVAQSDVVVENFRPGVLDRLGFGYDDLIKLKGDIILCSFSAFDPGSTARERPGQDLLMQATSGLATLSGPVSGPPIPVGAYVIDGFTAMQGVVGVLAALRHRDRTGEGQLVTADMFNTALYLMTQEASFALNAKSMNERPESGIAHSNHGAPYGIYDTMDGPIALSVFGGVDTVRKMVAALGLADELAGSLSEAGLKRDRDVIAQKLQREIARLSMVNAADLLRKAGAWVTPVRNLTAALEDPLTQECGAVTQYESEVVGKYRVVPEPLKMSKSPLTRKRPAPHYGEHSVEILKEIGVSQTEIHRLVEEGVVLTKDYSEAGHSDVFDSAPIL